MSDNPTPSVDPVDIESAKHTYRFLRLLAIIALVMGSASAFTLNLVDPDLWGHVVYGQELLAEGELPETATHTFTAEGYRWINHENLAEITFAWGFDNLGVRGMLVGKCLLGMAILSLMYYAARARDVRSLTAWAFLLLIASNLKAFFVMRPQLLSFACCAVMLLLLERAYRNWREEKQDETPDAAACRVQWRWLLPIPVLMVVWVNSHGAFVAGYCILGALLAGRAIEAILVDRWKSLPTVAGMTAIGLTCLAGLLANPYGIELLEWLRESLGSPRPEITEWAAPKIIDPVFWPLVTLTGVVGLSLAFTEKRRDWTKIAILLLVGWQAVEHVRHIAFFALLCGFWAPEHLQSALSRARRRAARGLPVTDTGPVIKWAAAGALAVAAIVPAFSIAERVTKLPVLRRMYPVDAFDFLAAHDINGRMVVSFNWAQYALAAFPDSTMSFDGRFRTCYPQEVVDMNFDFLLGEHKCPTSPFGIHQTKAYKAVFGEGDPAETPLVSVRSFRYRSPESGPLDPARVLEHGDPEIVIVDRKFVDGAAKVMELESARPDTQWALLYQDAVAQVWGRKRVFDDPTSSRYLAPQARLITDAPRPLAVQWPAMPVRRGSAFAAGDRPDQLDGES